MVVRDPMLGPRGLLRSRRGVSRAEPNLALAARRRSKQEDVLTEVLAGVIVLDRDLLEKLLERLPHGAWARSSGSAIPMVRVSTQAYVGGIGTLDLLLNVDGVSYWIENKIDAAFQHDQLERYAKLGPGLVIVPDRRAADVPSDPDRWTVMTWTDVVLTARALFVNEGIEFADASGPDALARHRARCDLIGYLEENYLTAPPRIETNDLVELARLNSVLGEAIPYVLSEIKSRAEAAGLLQPGIKAPPAWGDYSAGYVWCDADPGGWVEDVGGWYDVTIAGQPDFAEGPAVAVGMALHTTPDKQLQGLFYDERWKSNLGESGFQFVPLDWGARAIRAHQWGEVPSGSLAHQAGFIADAFIGSIESLRQLQPLWTSLALQDSSDDELHG